MSQFTLILFWFIGLFLTNCINVVDGEGETCTEEYMNGMATFKEQPTVVNIEGNKVRVSWEGAVENRQCLSYVGIEGYECDGDGSHLETRLISSSRDSVVMPVVPNNCFWYQVKLYSPVGIVVSDTIRVET